MKTYAICPISEKLMDERIARINASLTVVILLISVWFQVVWTFAFLAADFLLRGTGYEKYSLLANTSRFITQMLNLDKFTINAGPKMFAARVGFVFSLFILFFAFMGKPITANIAGSVLGLFCFLEATFGFCVACKIYPFVYRFVYKS